MMTESIWSGGEYIFPDEPQDLYIVSSEEMKTVPIQTRDIDGNIENRSIEIPCDAKPE